MVSLTGSVGPEGRSRGRPRRRSPASISSSAARHRWSCSRTPISRPWPRTCACRRSSTRVRTARLRAGSSRSRRCTSRCWSCWSRRPSHWASGIPSPIAATELGPVISARQRQRVLGFVERAVDSGAELLTGGVSGRRARTLHLAGRAREPETGLGDRARGGVRARRDGPASRRRRVRARLGQRHRLRPRGVDLDTRSCPPAMRGLRELNFGCVWVNDHLPFLSEMPYGGFGASGSARTCRCTPSRSTPASST